MASYCFRPNSPQSIAKAMAVHQYYGDWAQVRYHCDTGVDGTLNLVMEEEDEIEVNRRYLEICKLKGIDPDGHKPRKKNMGGVVFGLIYIVVAISFLIWQVKYLTGAEDQMTRATYMVGMAINTVVWFVAIPVFVWFAYLDWYAKKNIK